MKKQIIILLVVFTTIYSVKAQIPDPIANSQLSAINQQLALMNKTLASSKMSENKSAINSTKSLSESINQTKKLTATYEALQKVSKAVKVGNSVYKSVKLAYKITETFYNIMEIVIERNNQQLTNGMGNLLNPLVEKSQTIVKNIKSLLKDDEIKTDSGQRLSLIMQLNNELEQIYYKLYQIQNMLINTYSLSRISSPIKL